MEQQHQKKQRVRSTDFLSPYAAGHQIPHDNGTVQNTFKPTTQKPTETQVTENDYLPHQICNNCIQNISGAYFFRLQCHKAENMLYRLQNALSDISTPAKSQEEQEEEFALQNEEESISQITEDEQMTSENGYDYDKEMKIELEGIEYKINSEINDEDDESILEEYSDNEKEILEDSSPVQNFQIEIVSPPIQESGETAPEVAEKTKNKCTECDKVFEKKKHFTEHLRTYHPFSKIYKCDVCETRFTKVQSLRRHVKIHQADQKNKLCTFCGKGFTRADDLRRHTRIHTGERPYVCTICPKRYKQTSELKEHLATHSKDKNYICTICGKALQTRNGHYVHMRTHLGVKKHFCHFCGNRYVTAGELNSHIRHIHEKKKPFLCDVENCDRTFGTKLSLDIHKRAHTGERPFECSYCNKRLATASSLSEHIRIHTETNRLMCAICQKLFNGVQSLKRHMRTHYEYNDTTKDNPERNSLTKDAFECIVCEKNFTTLEDLETHAETHSTNEDQYEKIRDIHLVLEEDKADNYILQMECEDDSIQYVDS